MSFIEDIKEVASTIQKADNIDLYKQMLDIQKEALELIERINTLTQENKELKEELKVKENLVYESDMYYIKEDSNVEQVGPYCSRCWDKEKNLVRLHKSDLGYGEVYMICPECKTTVQVGKYNVNLDY